MFLIIGAVAGGLGVAFGAFGAHALRSTLTPSDLAVFETGVRYQMYHALALIAVGLLQGRVSAGPLALAGWLFVVGIVLFPGSLYTLVLTQQRWMGAITPLGGLAFVAGWAALAWAALKR